mgnify:CR=1 FL=1
MKKIVLSLLAFSFIGLYSCSNEPTTTTKEKVETTTKTSRHYSLLPGKAGVRWTAFKFTERAGVTGTFDNIEAKEMVEGESLSDALKGLSYKIPVSSINSNNEDRDSKLTTFFFGVMNETPAITGTFGEFNGNDQFGTCNIIINMNGLSQSVDFEYKVNENNLSFLSMIDMNNWEGEFALNSINKKCEDLHKGKDGKSVIWPEVKLEMVIPFSK